MDKKVAHAYGCYLCLNTSTMNVQIIVKLVITQPHNFLYSSQWIQQRNSIDPS